MSDLKEYEGYFEKFQDEFIRFKTGKKTYEKCPGCSEKKRFSINERKLTYSCGPKGGTKKCGPQWTIELPKYIDSDIREKELLDIIKSERQASSVFPSTERIVKTPPPAGIVRVCPARIASPVRLLAERKAEMLTPCIEAIRVRLSPLFTT